MIQIDLSKYKTRSCPFCGSKKLEVCEAGLYVAASGEATVESVVLPPGAMRGVTSASIGAGSHYYIIHCKNCMACGPLGQSDDLFKGQLWALKRWNRNKSNALLEIDDPKMLELLIDHRVKSHTKATQKGVKSGEDNG